MENAVKALFIAAGVLIGVMILTLGVSLYSSLNTYVQDYQDEIDKYALQKFNEKFTKYINYNEDTDQLEFAITIQDIVTVANTAYESNLKYQLTEHTENNYYITININTTEGKNLERTINTNAAEILKANLGKIYKCTVEDIKISPTTGRVFEVNFSEYVE